MVYPQYIIVFCITVFFDLCLSFAYYYQLIMHSKPYLYYYCYLNQFILILKYLNRTLNYRNFVLILFHYHLNN